MKKYGILCLVAAGMAAIGCNQKETPAVPEGGRIVTVQAVSAPLTKVLADENGAFTWEEGDAIGVWTGSELTKFTLDASSAGQAKGTFTGTLPAGGAIDENSYAVYPYDYVKVSGTTATLEVPSGTGVREAPVRLVPMYAKAGTGHSQGFAFKHLGAVARFSIENLPEEIISICLECSPGSPRQLWCKNGTTADLTADDPQFTGTGDEAYAFAIPEGEASHEKLDVYVPVIPGAYSNEMKLIVKLFKDSSASEVGEYTKSGNWGSKSTTFTRGQLLSMPTIKYASPYPEQLYIYFWAWDGGGVGAPNAQPMTQVSRGVFSWSGHFVTGAFKFLTSNATSDDYWTGYFRDPDASDYWTMRESSDEVMFRLEDKSMPAGWYTITADTKTKKVSIEKSTPDRLYVYAWAWDPYSQNASPMTSLGEGKFTWSGILPRWEFKFGTNKLVNDDYWSGYFRDPDAADYWTMKESSEKSDEVLFKLNDQGFRDGWFTLNVDLNTLKVEVIPHIWLIGTAFSWGWNRDEAEEMTWNSASRTFTWTGNLYTGPFKFLVTKDTETWYGYWRNSTDADYWIAGEEYNNDAQFDITHDGLEAGNYTITFDLNTKKVTVTPAT